MSLRGLIDYLRTGLWRVPLGELHPGKSFLVRSLRIIVLSVKGFDDDRCTLRAASLTFFTLLSIVPVIAMIFAIAKGFGFESTMEAKLKELAEGQEVAIERIITFSRNLLENTSGGVIAGVGVVVLLWSVIRLLASIEHSFNEIWGVQRPRTWIRKLSDYMFFVIVAPVVFMIASSATVFFTTAVRNLTPDSFIVEWFGWIALLALRILPFVLIWLLFIFMYVFMPNCKVRYDAAFLGGVVAGGLFQLAQWGYITFQLGVSRYGAIYGSFAALPLFLIWLNVSWLIVLYGAELCFARQHVDTYEFEPDCRAASDAARKVVALAAVHQCVKRFDAGEAPLTADELSSELGVPARLLNEILADLVDSRVLATVSDGAGREEGVHAYQPALPTDQITVADVIRRLEDHGQETFPRKESEALERIAASLRGLREAGARSAENVRLRDL